LYFFSKDEINIIHGAIDLKEKTAGAAMTPIDRVAMLNLKDNFSEEVCKQVGFFYDCIFVFQF
jgi:CBS domain containing-hemolysin-like protein